MECFSFFIFTSERWWRGRGRSVGDSCCHEGLGGDQMMGVFLSLFRFFLRGGGGILIPCRIKRTDVGKLINKSSGDVEVRCRITRRQRRNTKAQTPLNPSLLEGDMIPRASKNQRGWGVLGGGWHFLFPVDIQSLAALIHQIRSLLIISIH